MDTFLIVLSIILSLLILLSILVLTHYNGYKNGFKMGFEKGYSKSNEYILKVNHAQGERIKELMEDNKTKKKQLLNYKTNN